MTEESTHEAEHDVRWHLCVPGMKSHSGQEMKKARTSFRMQLECDVDSYPLRRGSPALKDAAASCNDFP